MSKPTVAVIMAIVMFSCNSTKITSSGKAASGPTKAYKTILVWGILTEKDSVLRSKMETHLVNDLSGKGYRAFSSMEVYKNRAFKKLSEKEVVDEFKNTGVDAVITIALLNKEKEQVFVPAGIVNNGMELNHMEKYYSSVYDRVFKPGYYVTTTNYFWESNFFDVAADKLVYTARTKSFDPSSAERLAHENGMIIVKDMLKKKIIVDKIPATDQ